MPKLPAPRRGPGDSPAAVACVAAMVRSLPPSPKARSARRPRCQRNPPSRDRVAPGGARRGRRNNRAHVADLVYRRTGVGHRRMSAMTRIAKIMAAAVLAGGLAAPAAAQVYGQPYPQTYPPYGGQGYGGQ